MHQQYGFIRCELYETKDGWFDSMLWEDQASADAGNTAFAATDIAADFAKIVQPNFKAFAGELVHLG